MEFSKANFLNTTTQIAVSNNTLTVQNLFNRDPIYQYYTDGMNDDNTTTSITVTFDATTSVSRITMLDINFKEFNFYYDNTTTNSFTLLNGATTTSSFNANTDTNKFFKFSTISCSSITFKAKKTMTANQEKVLGYLSISDLILTMALIPTAKGYKPKLTPKQVVHKLSDGGVRIHNVRKKHEATLNLDYVSRAQRDSLLNDIYSAGDPVVFTPFATSTSWDGLTFECVWDGPFEFYEYSDNATVSGFSGKVSLKETPY